MVVLQSLSAPDQAGVPFFSKMHPSWKAVLAESFSKPYFRELAEFLAAERKTQIVYPPEGEVFAALDATPYDRANVLILGQDPYHGHGQAHGLAFSVRKGVVVPPSLQNVYRELQTDVGAIPPGHGYLGYWAEQGVLLLNSVLTVRAHEPGSHRDRGWEPFTNAVISALNARETPVVFVLWGAYARAKIALLDAEKHTIIESAHPSPMSARSGFFGSKPFSRTNEALAKAGLPEINWQLPY